MKDLLIKMSSMATLLLMVTVVLLVPLTPTVRDEPAVDWWPMFHHDLRHTGYSTSTAPSTNDTLWIYRTGEYSAVYSSPAVVDGRVYVGSGYPDHKAYCLDAATGSLIWSYTAEGSVGSPAVADGRVYGGSLDRKVYCFGEGVPPPITVSVSTDKEIYGPGDTMRVSLRLRNPGAETKVHFDWYLWCRVFFPIVVHFDRYLWCGEFFPIVVLPGLPLPAGYDKTFDCDIPVGDWGGTPFQAAWSVALLDLETWEVISFDHALWRYQPTGGAVVTQEYFAARVARAARKAASGVLLEEN